jgi:hypothetical protein
VIEVEKCLSIKGAEDVINKPHAFEISTHSESMYFIADSDKEKVSQRPNAHSAMVAWWLGARQWVLADIVRLRPALAAWAVG